MKDSNYNPLDAGKAFNEAVPSELPDITKQETLDQLDRLQTLVNETRDVISGD